jgi:hypothetical protein
MLSLLIYSDINAIRNASLRKSEMSEQRRCCRGKSQKDLLVSLSFVHLGYIYFTTMAPLLSRRREATVFSLSLWERAGVRGIQCLGQLRENAVPQQDSGCRTAFVTAQDCHAPHPRPLPEGEGANVAPRRLIETGTGRQVVA